MNAFCPDTVVGIFDASGLFLGKLLCYMLRRLHHAFRCLSASYMATAPAAAAFSESIFPD